MKELVEGQNLFDYINSTTDKNRVLCEKLIWEIFIQIVLALNYIHVEKGVVHRDLKLENILVDEMMNLKVADFGFATYKKINKLQSYRGTMTYMAPEIKEGKTYDGKQIDMFSVGVILFIIV